MKLQLLQMLPSSQHSNHANPAAFGAYYGPSQDRLGNAYKKDGYGNPVDPYGLPINLDMYGIPMTDAYGNAYQTTSDGSWVNSAQATSPTPVTAEPTPEPIPQAPPPQQEENPGLNTYA
jgi:hypothetical protein